jgi:5-methylcytosine-specific restriction endonuclease McrA
MKANPCPASGATAGRCVGWQVDHITPLKCGGADAPHNMQWLTVEQHKIKTAAEAKLCRRPRAALLAG